jgi:hypothetical protein
VLCKSKEQEPRLHALEKKVLGAAADLASAEGRKELL